MRRPHPLNIVFVDLLFNLMLAMTCLFFLSFLLINPISEEGAVTPPVQILIEMSWDKESTTDIDLYVLGPDGSFVWYGDKEMPYMTLERDDTGAASDEYIINGKPVITAANYEVIAIRDLPDGEYFVTAHYFSKEGDRISPQIKITQVAPFTTLFSQSYALDPREEWETVSFVVQDGAVVDIRTDVTRCLRCIAETMLEDRSTRNGLPQ